MLFAGMCNTGLRIAHCYMSKGTTLPTRLHVCLAKTQISLCSLIRVIAVDLKMLWVIG